MSRSSHQPGVAFSHKVRIIFSRRPTLAILTGVLIGAAAQPLAAQLSFRTVAVTGEPAPGNPPGSYFSNLAGQPVLNSRGSVVFGSAIQPPTGSARLGIMSDVSGSLSLVVQNGQPAPPPGNFFSQLTSGNINDNGAIGFCATVDGDFYYPSLFAHQMGTSTTLGYPGQPAPGDTPPGTFSWLCSRGDGLIVPPSVSPDGSMMAYGNARFGSLSRGGLWRFTSNDVQLVARASDPAPGAGSAIFLQFGRPLSPQFGYVTGMYPMINSSNETAFYAWLTFSTTLTSRGIWQQTGGALQLVIRSGTQAPGLDAGVLFSDFGDPALNNAGNLVFHGSLTGASINPTNNESVWSTATGALSLVAQKGAPAPDVPAGVHFGSFIRPDFYDVIVGGSGDAAFASYLSGADVTPQNEFALWAQRSGVLGLVAREGDPAPGTSAGTVFADGLAGDYLPYMNDAGLLVFKASLAGPGVTTANDEGFWAMLGDGTLQMLFREGDELEVRPGDFRTLSFANYFPRVPTGGQDGRQRILNNYGELAVSAGFTDGTQAILVFTIPEPATAAILALATAASTARRPRRALRLEQSRLMHSTASRGGMAAASGGHVDGQARRSVQCNRFP
jgi:hypothetical protein